MFTFSNLFKRGANYLLLVLLARSISISEIGIYSAYLNVLALLVLITNFGFSEFLLVNSENKNQLKVNTINFFQISLCIFAVLILLSVLIPLKDNILCVLVLIKIYFETTIYNILLAHHQVAKKLRVITIMNITIGLFVILTCILCYFFKENIYTYLISINLVYGFTFFYLFSSIKIKFSPLKNVFIFIKKSFSNLKYYGLTMITVPIYMMAPTVIGSLLLEPEILAQYQAAFSIANILLLVSVSLLQEGYVKFVSCKHNILELTKVLKKTGSKIILVNVFILVLFILFGKIILLTVYKQEAYLEAYYPLIILLFGNIIFMFAAIFSVTMVVLKLQKEKAKFHLEFILVSMFFGLLLTYIYGVYGLLSSYIILYSYSTIRYMFRFNEIYKSLTQKKKI
ncbi:MAG: oligosaccharide flippase family protein [Flavobacteriales bacterium]